LADSDLLFAFGGQRVVAGELAGALADGLRVAGHHIAHSLIAADRGVLGRTDAAVVHACTVLRLLRPADAGGEPEGARAHAGGAVAAHRVRPAGRARRQLRAVVVPGVRVDGAAGAAGERAAGAGAAARAVRAVAVGAARGAGRSVAAQLVVVAVFLARPVGRAAALVVAAVPLVAAREDASAGGADRPAGEVGHPCGGERKDADDARDENECERVHYILKEILGRRLVFFDKIELLKTENCHLRWVTCSTWV